MKSGAGSRFDLFRTRRFWPLFTTQALGAFNDNVFRNALVILITYRLADTADMDTGSIIALAGGLFILPFFLFSGLAGELADKFDKARIARTVKLVEIGVASLAAVALFSASVPLMLAVLFLMGAQSTFFGPVKYAILPQHLADNELVDANAFIETATFLAILLGTLFGGLLILRGQGLAVVSLSMIAIAVAGWWAARRIPPAPAPMPDLRVRRNFLASTLGVMRAVAGRRRLFGAVLAISWFWMLGALLLALVPPFTRHFLGGDETVANFFIALFTIGIAIGALAASRLLKGEISIRLAPVAALLLSISLFDLWLAARALTPLTEDAPLRSLGAFIATWEGARIALHFVLSAAFGGLFVVPFYAWLQHHAPEGERARVIAANNVFNALFMAVGQFLLALALARGLDVSQVFGLLAAANGLVAFYLIWRMPRDFLRSLGRGLFRLLYRVEVRGLEKFEEAGPRAVIIANHQSFLDGPLLATWLPSDTHYAINTITARGFFSRLATKIFEVLPIDPTNPMATRTLIKAVQQDKRLVIFPEGRISTTGGLMKIYEGPGVIAHLADAPIVPVRIEGAQRARFFSRQQGKQRLQLFPKITITVFEPVRMQPPEGASPAQQRKYLADKLYDVMTEAAFRASPWRRHLMEAVLDVRAAHGGGRKVVEDIMRAPLSLDKVIIGCHVLGHRLARMTPGEETLGVLLPTSAGCLVTLLGLLTNGRTPAMLNFSTGAVNMAAACTAAKVKTIITSRRFVEQGGLEETVEFLGRDARVIYLEDVRESLGLKDKLRGLALARMGHAGLKLAGADLDPESTAVILFTSGSEGVPKGVVLSHANVMANAYQVLARVDLNASDIVFNALPMFHALGLSAGVFLPLVAGSRLFLYPSPLHYKIIPELVYDTNATVLFGTDTFLTGYARNAHPYDFYNVRFVVAGAERVKKETREVWMEKFGLRIYEGYGATETAPVLSVNTPMHFRSGTVGRLLPAIEHRIEPVEGIAEGGRLVVKGPNVMKGYLRADTPGVIEPPADGWYDTGDIVRVDGDGFVIIEGRAKRFAKIGGEMVSLTAVENVINAAYPEEAHAVVNVPDPKKGEKLVLITTRAGLSRRDLARAVKEAGAPELYVPREILEVEEIPVLGSGKTDYVKLDEMARERFAP